MPPAMPRTIASLSGRPTAGSVTPMAASSRVRAAVSGWRPRNRSGRPGSPSGRRWDRAVVYDSPVRPMRALDHRHPELPLVPPAVKRPGSGPDREARGGQGLLDLADGELAEVEDAGRQDSVGARLGGGGEVADLAGAAAGDDGDVDRRRHGGDQVEVVAGLLAVGVHAGDQELPGATAGALLGPGEGVQPGGGAAAVDHHLPAAAVAAAPGVDGQHHALDSVGARPGRQQLGVADGGRVDRHLVGAGPQQPLDVLDGPDPAADGERDEHLLGRPGHGLEQGRTGLHGGGDVQEHELVGALGVIDAGQLGRVAGVDQVHERHPLDDPPGGNVQARDHPPGQGHARRPLPRAGSARAARASVTVKRPAYRALPTMAPSRPSGSRAARARRSSRVATPPEAITGRLVAARTWARRSVAGPVSMPSLATSVWTKRRQPAASRRWRTSNRSPPLAVQPRAWRVRPRASRPTATASPWPAQASATHSGSSRAAVPITTRAAPSSIRASRSAAVRTPPEASTLTGATAATMRPRTWRLRGPRPKAASRSTTCSQRAPWAAKPVAASTGSP